MVEKYDPSDTTIKLSFQPHRPLAMRKDGIQTRKRKPKKSASSKSQDGAKKDGHSSPGTEGWCALLTFASYP